MPSAPGEVADFEPQVLDAIECGIGVWRAALGPHERMPEVRGVRLILSTHPAIAEASSDEIRRAAATWRPTDNVMTFVVDRIGSADAWCKLAAHELGHGLGLEHASSPALMGATPAGPCLTSNDVEACELAGLACKNTCGLTL